MDVSVVVSTWNRATLLDQTLEGMRRLEVPAGLEWELLVVNNNCTDETDAVIARHQGALPVRRLFEPKPGLSNARNCAVAAARGDLIVWTDDDVLVNELWLAAVVGAAARHPDAIGFGGPIEPWYPVPPDPDCLAAFPALRTGFCGIDHGLPEGPIPTQDIWGANMAYRRRAHLAHPFDTSLGPRPSEIKSGSSAVRLSVGGFEEVDFVKKLRSAGGQIVWVPAMRVKHYVDPRRMTLPYLCSYVKDQGWASIRVAGVPPGARILGVPRWLIREWVEVTAATYWYHSVGRDRRLALAKKKRQWQLCGMIGACFCEWRRSRHVGSSKGNPGPAPAISTPSGVDVRAESVTL